MVAAASAPHSSVYRGTAMNGSRGFGFTHSIQGQILRRSERREVAIFLRDRVLWVADFIDGQGELVDAPTWFRFNCGELSTTHARRRMVLESAIPLSRELVERIERLHLQASARKSGAMVRLAETIAAHLPRSRFSNMVAARLCRRQSPPIDSPDSDRSI
jgi:hypothetical protein